MGPGARLPESCELRSRNTFRTGVVGRKNAVCTFFSFPWPIPSRGFRDSPAGRLVPPGHTLSAGCDRESSLMSPSSIPEIPRMEGYVNWLFVVAPIAGSYRCFRCRFIAYFLRSFELYVPRTPRFSFSAENITLELP